MGMPVPRGAHLIRLWAFLQKEIILLISKARGPLAPPGPACRVPSSILGRKSLAKGLPTLQLLPSCGAAGAGAGGRWQAPGWGPGALGLCLTAQSQQIQCQHLTRPCPPSFRRNTGSDTGSDGALCPESGLGPTTATGVPGRGGLAG